MQGDFDYFLILTVLAVVLVVVLLISLMKRKPEQRADAVSVAPRRTDRVRARPQESTISKPKIELPPIAPRVMTVVFYDRHCHPIAVLMRSTLGAQGWGTQVQGEKPALTTFINKYLQPQANEMLTLHYPQSEVPSLGDVLAVKAFGEKGNPIEFTSDLIVRDCDFPQYDRQENLHTWLQESPFAIYRQIFLLLDEVQQTLLSKVEFGGDQAMDQEIWALMNQDSRLAVCYLLLHKLAAEEDFFVRMGRYNRFSAYLNSHDAQEYETLHALERLIISQSFVQTQKMPIFLVRTSTGGIQWSKALKY